MLRGGEYQLRWALALSSRSKALSDQSSDAEKDKKVPMPLAGEFVPCYSAAGEAGSNAAQVPEGNLTNALAIILIGRRSA